MWKYFMIVALILVAQSRMLQHEEFYPSHYDFDMEEADNSHLLDSN